METLVRGTTPTFEILFDETDVSMITVAILSIKQGNTTIIEKELDSATVGEKSLSWTLTQEESLTLSTASKCIVVCDWKTSDGTRGLSEDLVCTIKPPGKPEVI